MKNLRKIALGMCFLMVFCLFGCGKNIESAKISRDDERVGGSLSFVYDKKERLISVGGDGEILQYCAANIEKGYDEGNRVGIKVVAPDVDFNLENSKLKMNGRTYAMGEFYQTVDGQKQRFFNLYPIFSEDDKEACFSVVWDKGIEEQKYKVKIADGTVFAQKSE